MDLTGFYHDANVEFTSYYLPVSIMGENLVKWLDESIISGWGTDGGIVFRGPLNQFPFENESGIMDIVFNASDVILEFQKDWPKLKGTQAQIQFTEKGMWIESDYSNLLAAESTNTRVSIARYLDPVLKIQSDLKGTVADGVEFLKRSELITDEVLLALDAEDDININLDLTIPLAKAESDNRIRITLNNADYFPPALKRTQGLVSDLRGEVLVHNQSIEAKELTAKIMGEPARIQIDTTVMADRTNNVKVLIEAPASIENLRRYEVLPVALEPFSRHLTGKTNVKVRVDFPNKKRPLTVNIFSDLKGVRSRLPAPLAKESAQSLPLTLGFIDVRHPSQAKELRQMDLQIDDIVSLSLLLDTTEQTELLKGNIHFGAETAEMPRKTLFRVSGALQEFPFEQWQKTLNVSSGKSTGTGNIQDTGKYPVAVELAMSELVLPDFLASEPSSKSESTRTTDQKTSPLTSQQFPVINGTIDNVYMGKKLLGKLTLNSSRVDRSIIFDVIKLEGEHFTFRGSGKWHHWNALPEVDLDGELHIPSMETFTSHLGYEQLMRGGEADISGYISWPGSIADYSKKTLEGKLSIDVRDGVYLEGQPGAAGRLLGLLNMNALVRRLTLDFSDVTTKGFEFDQIIGDFRLNQGNAYTDNLRLSAPSTKLLMTGRIGLVTEDFDQRVTVIPEVSATLPLAGAAVAGPAGAAVVWVGQKLLGERINRVTAFDYTVKGSWSEPEITRDKTSSNTLKHLKKIFNEEKPEILNGDKKAVNNNLIEEENETDLP